MKSLQPYIWLAAFTVGLNLSALGAENKVDFAKDIQPILQKTCLKCHGPEKSKGHLRLDNKPGAFKSDKDIVPGHADKSDLYRRITLPPGDDDVMPAKGELLTKAQTDLIRKWIDEGANWPEGLVISKVDFAKDIQPILQKSCLQCHGPEKSKGKLRLDNKAAAFKSDEDIVAGHADKSELYRRITLPPGDDDIMPAKGDLLTKVEIDLIREWINQGAEWPDGLIIKSAEEQITEKDPRKPVKPSDAEKKAIAQLNDLGVQVRPVAMNVTWTTANFRGIDSNNVAKALPLLAQIQTLEDVNLAGLNLNDESLKPLAGLVNLTHLHLEKNPIGDAGLAYLKGLLNLTYLNLYDTQVGDAGLNQLKELKRLKNVYLWQTKVSDEGAKNLQAALPKVDINRGWELTALAKEEEKKTEPKTEEAKAETKPKEKKAEPKKVEPKKEETKAGAAKKDEPAKEQKKDK